MINDFLQQQVNFIKLTADTLTEVFEEPIKLDFIHSDIFSAAVIDCDSEDLVQLMKRRLFNWQLENTEHWNQRLVHITDKEAVCTLTAQNQQEMTLQF